jgi:hypothetical protein
VRREHAASRIAGSAGVNHAATRAIVRALIMSCPAEVEMLAFISRSISAAAEVRAQQSFGPARAAAIEAALIVGNPAVLPAAQAAVRLFGAYGRRWWRTLQ